MDKELQKIILGIIKAQDGISTWKLILSKSQRQYWKANYPIKGDVLIKHQLDLLEEEDKVLRVEQLPDIYYKLTPKGHKEFNSMYRKAWDFILYDKNNIWTLLSIVISIGSLIIAIVALKN